MAGVPTPENFSTGAVQGNIDAQKRALLSALAMGGSAMAQQVGAQQASTAASGQAVAQAAAARAMSPEAAAPAQAMSQYHQQISANQGAVAKSFMDNLAASSSRYMDEVGAAVPLVQSQTQQQLNSLGAAAQQSQADRALKLQLAQLQMQETQARIAAAHKANQVDPLDEEHKRLTNEALRQSLANNGVNTPGEQLQQRQLDQLNAADHRKAAVEELLSHEGPAAAAAARLALSGAGNQAEALANLMTNYEAGNNKTPKGKDLDKAYMKALLARIFAVQ